MRDRPPCKEHDWDDYPPGDSIDFATACMVPYGPIELTAERLAKLEQLKAESDAMVARWMANNPVLSYEEHARRDAIAAEKLAAENAAERAATPLYCEPTHRYPMEVDEEPPPDSDDKAYQS